MAMKNYPAPKPTPSHDRLSITTATGAGSSCITHVCKKWISFADSLPYAWGLGATLVPIQEGGKHSRPEEGEKKPRWR